MKRQTKNLGGTSIRRRSRNANKQIRDPKNRIMTFVGIDAHKNTLQVAAIDDTGRLIFNKKIKNNRKVLARTISGIRDGARFVLESSSVWYGLFKYMRDDLGLDVVLSNPYNTKIIATSLKKTDKVDAFQLANMLRGGYIAECHVPEEKTVGYRKLVRHRNKIMRERTLLKNSIHGITLQEGIKQKHKGFSQAHVAELRKLNNYRIDSYLRLINSVNEEIARADARIHQAVRNNEDATLLMSIPGVGYYTALVIIAEIDDIKRFSNPHKLCAYAGLVPSVRNSADTIHHGRITKRGSKMLRWVMVEAVHTHVRYAPESDLSIFYNRLAKKRGRSKGAVAAASKLLRIIYRMLEEKNG